MAKIAGQRLGHANLTRENVADSHTLGNNTPETRSGSTDGRFTPAGALGIVMQMTKNDVSLLQLIDSILQSPYCAPEKARTLVVHAAQSTMEIVHVSPATVFHVRQALTVEGQLALVLLNAFLNYGHGRNLLSVSDHTASR
jgi:hypothetical protein